MWGFPNIKRLLYLYHHHPANFVKYIGVVETIIVDNLLTKRCKTSPIKVWRVYVVDNYNV